MMKLLSFVGPSLRLMSNGMTNVAEASDKNPKGDARPYIKKLGMLLTSEMLYTFQRGLLLTLLVFLGSFVGYSSQLQVNIEGQQ